MKSKIDQTQKRKAVIHYVMTYMVSLGLIFNPLFISTAEASKYSKLKGGHNYDKACDSGKIFPKGTNGEPSNLEGACTQAKILGNVVKVEIVKEVLYATSVATVVGMDVGVHTLDTAAKALVVTTKAAHATAATAMATACAGPQAIALCLPATFSESNALLAMTNAIAAEAAHTTSQPLRKGCKGIGIAIPVAAVVSDAAVMIANKQATEIFGKLMGAVGAVMGSAMLKSMMGMFGKNMAAKAAKINECEEAIFGLSIGLATTSNSMVGAIKGFDTAALNAAAMAADLQKQTELTQENDKPMKNAFSRPNMGGGSRSEGQMASGSTTGKDSSNDCLGTATGNSFLECAKSSDPELSKMLSSNDLMDQVKKAIGGKNVGDFLRNAPSDPSAMNSYVAGAMGQGAAGADVLKLARELGDKIKPDSNSPVPVAASTYVASGKPAAAPAVTGEAEPDFAKIMAEMMKNLNPGMASEEVAKNGDPAERVYRQMDLLPAEKLMQNRDISLFARIGFRYRKSLDKVDSLNWASPTNGVTSSQDANGRGPAQNH